jgi:hypothetical protein
MIVGPGDESKLPVPPGGDLARLEAVIERGLTTFIEVGAALLEIRERRLYREGFDSFEGYCRDRWGMARRTAYRYIEAAEVVDHVSDRTQVLPANVEQTRPLASLLPDQQRVAWARSVETAPDGRPTGEHVRAVVDDLFPKDGPPPRPDPVPDG